jgi:hypothetical protein
VSSVPRHSEEELRQQWAFLDALVDRQAASLKSGIQDPEEDDAIVATAAPDASYLDEISTLTQRVTTLEDERTTLLRRIDLSEEARVAAEAAREAAEAARVAAERALAQERSRLQPRLQPWPEVTVDPRPVASPAPPRQAAAVTIPSGPPQADSGAETKPSATPPTVAAQPATAPPTAPAPAGTAPKAAAPKGRRKSWWQRIRE